MLTIPEGTFHRLTGTEPSEELSPLLHRLAHNPLFLYLANAQHTPYRTDPSRGHSKMTACKVQRTDSSPGASVKSSGRFLQG